MKTATVLRTAVPLTTEQGTKLAPGTRVRVMSSKRVSEAEGREVVKVKVEDATLPNLAGEWFTAAPGAFKATYRGRPTKIEG